VFDHGHHDHAGRGRERRAASGAGFLREEFLGQVRAPDPHGRHRLGGISLAMAADVAIRTNERQVWFVSEHLVDVPLVKAD